jgi:cell shape-determining protein MreC
MSNVNNEDTVYDRLEKGIDSLCTEVKQLREENKRLKESLGINVVDDEGFLSHLKKAVNNIGDIIRKESKS